MADLHNFNANHVEPTTEFEAIPAGKYEAIIVDSELKPTKSGTGHYLQLSFQIQEGDCKGRIIWTRLNLDNPNATAVKIARSELSAICHAVGVMEPKDSVDLHNLPMVIDVKCRKRTDSDEITNEISSYTKREATVRSPKASVPGAAAPWKR